MLTFRDQKILISGASSGIGNSVVYLLNSLGVNTVLIGRDKSKLEKTLSQLQQPENASIIICDFLDEINLKGEFLKSVADSGTFTGFVHSAGADITKPHPYKGTVFRVRYQYADSYDPAVSKPPK